MKLSIITCVYNSEKYLQKTINSVLLQNMNKNIYEHVFIDGFSSDNTIDIIEEYIKENPNNNIQLKQCLPKGIYNAMNEGIKVSKGEYILFLHSDDFLENDILNNYLQFILNTGNKDFYYAKVNSYSEEEKKVIGYIPNRSIYQKGLKDWLMGFICYVSQPGVISKKKLHDKYGLFNENFKIVSDWEFFIKLTKNKVKGIFYNKSVNNFRIHEGSTSSGNIKNKGAEEENIIIDKYYKNYSFIYKFIKNIYRKIFY